MEVITIQKQELKDIVREAVSEAIYLDEREVLDSELSDKTLTICQKADKEEFLNNTASSFDEVYKKCMK